MGARPDDYDIERCHELERSLDRDAEREPRRFLRSDFRRRMTGRADAPIAVDTIHVARNEEP